MQKTDLVLKQSTGGLHWGGWADPVYRPLLLCQLSWWLSKVGHGPGWAGPVHHCSQPVRARELKFWENVHPTPCVTCNMSHVFLFLFIFYKVVVIVSGGSVTGMTEPEPRFGKTFCFALFCQGLVLFARFLPVFARFSPGFAQIRFCSVLPKFARICLFSFVVRMRSSPKPDTN